MFIYVDMKHKPTIVVYIYIIWYTGSSKVWFYLVGIYAMGCQ